MTAQLSFSALLDSVKDAGEDFEWYPTTQRFIDIVSRQLDKSSGASIMDIGAGDGRVLARLAEGFARFNHVATLYAIEKSAVLIEAQPENVIPVGTDLFEQNLACLPVDYLVSNPPYSEFEAWATMIIESGHAKKAFLILPQRWNDNPAIKLALTKRGATARVLHSDDFYDAPRRARAVIDIIEVSYPLKDDHYYRNAEVKDPFDIWFDENISTFDAAETDGTDYEREQQGLAKLRTGANTIGEMVAAYREEYDRMEGNYKAIFRLDYALLKELGVNKENVRDGIKVKMAGLKSKYWTVLFERLDVITNRLSTATKAAFSERLIGRVVVAFTSNNAYAIVLWAIKNANRYFNEQTVKLYRDLSTFEGALKYKSNVRTWGKHEWRYFRSDEDETRPTRYALDYRIIVEGWRGIGGGYEYPGALYKTAHELIADILAVLFNLGFPARGERSRDREWRSGGWQDWYRLGPEPVILFQAKAYQNGNMTDCRYWRSGMSETRLIGTTRPALIINGVRCAVTLTAGPWVEGVNPDLIKLRPKKFRGCDGAFPASFRAALDVENLSDSREDYHDTDCIRLLPGHPLYAAAKAVAA